jgi:NADP-dependent aldehyde dehydrogenase
MSSVNPVVILPGALADGDAAVLAQGFVGSLTMGAGQFCTNPGLVFVPAGEAGDRFLSEASAAVAQQQGQPMLTPEIASAYEQGIESLRSAPGVEVVAEGQPGEGNGRPAPVLSLAAWPQAKEAAVQEVFGASSVVVRYDDVEKVATTLSELEGQLTATVHYSPSDRDAARRLLPVLEDLAGRVLFNGWPTGVEVGHAMVHGGPWPATSAPGTTSVGSLAIERFQRPVCYQDVPDDVLPEPLRDDNPWSLTRRVDGVLEVGKGVR